MEFWPGDSHSYLFNDCRESAFHMEVRDSYAEPAESEALRRFLDNEPSIYDKSDWTDLIERMTGRGVAVSRIRVVTVPHSGYQRWLLSVTDQSVEAGEDIRYVPRYLVDPGLIPPEDWWIFDNELVVFNLTDTAGKPVGGGITTDPGIVAHCQGVRDRLWALATPYGDYYASQATPQ